MLAELFDNSSRDVGSGEEKGCSADGHFGAVGGQRVRGEGRRTVIEWRIGWVGEAVVAVADGSESGVMYFSLSGVDGGGGGVD